MSDSALQARTPALHPGPVRGPGAGERETTLYDGQGVLVTSERVVVAGHSWPLGDVERVESVRRAPRVFPWLMTLLVGVVLGLPVLLSAMAVPNEQGKELYGAALVVAGTAIFGSIAALLVIGDTYWLVLRTQQREGHVLRSRDPLLISSLVTVVAKAAEAARRRHGAAIAGE